MSDQYVWRLYYTNTRGSWEYDDYDSREDRAEAMVESMDDYEAFVLREGFQSSLNAEPEVI